MKHQVMAMSTSSFPPPQKTCIPFPLASHYPGEMRADDLTRAQARAIKNKLGPMVAYLNRLGKRMSDRGFPVDDPARLLVTATLKAIYELQADMKCRSMDGRGLHDVVKPPTIDEQLARRSAPRKHEKYRLGRPRPETH